jgi:hypothetical protein
MKLAIEHIKRMPGGAQPHVMRCDDGEYYVVKFQNNPQNPRILANEMLATRLATRMGVSVPEVSVVEVRSPLIKRTPELVIQMGRGCLPCAPGKQFGSKYLDNPSSLIIREIVPDEHLKCVTNIKDFLELFAFDKWTCNTDRRQAVFFRIHNLDTGNSPCCFRVTMIDQGFCFDGGNWNFPDGPRCGLYFNRKVYLNVTALESFEPWLHRLKREISLSMLFEEAEEVPIEWLGNNLSVWRALVEQLYARRIRVRELIWSAKNARPQAFPNWITSAWPIGVPKSASRGRACWMAHHDAEH